MAVTERVDVAIIGAGIMSATFGTLIRLLQPDWTIAVYERLPEVGLESSEPWNNAGTGHAGLCELNYSPRGPDGTVDISKAMEVNEKFQVSRQFWAWAVEHSILGEPGGFITAVDHFSFVEGAENVKYLRRRYDTLAPHPLFADLSFSADPGLLADRLPLLAAGRNSPAETAISWSTAGTDVDFGQLTRGLFEFLCRTTPIHLDCEVTSLFRADPGWRLDLEDRRTKRRSTVDARFVFVGAGGHSLSLLRRARVREVRHVGGFPVSGQFLRCTNPEVVNSHHAKVFGLPAPGAPPMSARHLDTRIIDGRRHLEFGAYSGWSPRFLKYGSALDFPRSVGVGNLVPLARVAMDNRPLLRFLIEDATQPMRGRLRALREFAPGIQPGDWELITAGQRVQSVLSDGWLRSGTLEFGTSVAATADGSLTGFLGTLPGASGAVSAVLALLDRCFPAQRARWASEIRRMIPAYGRSLNSDPALCEEISAWTNSVLRLRAPA
ncbi:malate dehydrogenase (quinone) [Nocardia sp. CDC160]|uniref:malate dehydrogenase (quinone) n=1 Tax=Nocardia sp. CDC160 TaxID=3112166 RepID=UPI002DB5CCE9|nr:malate dehydrogenase (quinone) [Nocardia sp. CDC160]MEC3917441.1 malate dehydrogenase (quinone) [Nocardia sp. CDC160]